MASPQTSNLTSAAITSRSAQSSLLSAHSRKRRKKSDNVQNYTNVALFVTIGCFIGYSMNYIYNKFYGENDEDDYSDDDENIDEFHKKRISELKKSRSSMYTLPPHYALKVYQSDTNRKKAKKTPSLLTKSVSSLWTPRKRKKPKKDIFEIYNDKQTILTEMKKQIFHYKHSFTRNLLFISNETYDGYQRIKEFMGKDMKNLLLIPFGHEDWESHTKYMEQKIWEIGKKCTSIHKKRNMIKLIGQCDGIIINGGNTYKLLYYLYHYNLISILQTVIDDGLPFIGIESGVNIACCTIQTAFDVPILQPPSFKALSIIPFQLIAKFDSFYSDIYDKQIREFLKESKDYKTCVLGLCNDCYIEIKKNRIRLYGTGKGAVLFRNYHIAKEEVSVGGLLSSLLN